MYIIICISGISKSFNDLLSLDRLDRSLDKSDSTSENNNPTVEQQNKPAVTFEPGTCYIFTFYETYKYLMIQKIIISNSEFFKNLNRFKLYIKTNKKYVFFVCNSFC